MSQIEARYLLADARAGRPCAEAAKPTKEDPAVWITEAGDVWRRVNRSHPERRQWVKRKPEIDKDGYARLSIKGKNYFVHRLVYSLFIGDLVEGLVVCHVNGDKRDNSAPNLLQATQAENIGHKRGHGTWQFGENHPRAKATEADVRRVKDRLDRAARLTNGRLARGEPSRIAMQEGVSIHLVYDLNRNRGWHHVQ